jgi:hypothetical protein
VIFRSGQNLRTTENDHVIRQRGRHRGGKHAVLEMRGILWPETAITLRNGVSLQQFVCIICHRQWYGSMKVPRAA